MSDNINRERRRFFGGAAMTFAAAQLSLNNGGRSSIDPW